MSGYLIMRAEQGNVGYWSEVLADFRPHSDEGTLYNTREEALEVLADLKRAERWQYLIHGITLVVIPD